MSKMTETDLAALRNLIQRARDERKALWCSYQDLWFSPDELEKANDEGRFCWGVVNWKLRDPNERAKESRAALDGATIGYERSLTWARSIDPTATGR